MNWITEEWNHVILGVKEEICNICSHFCELFLRQQINTSAISCKGERNDESYLLIERKNQKPAFFIWFPYKIVSGQESSSTGFESKMCCFVCDNFLTSAL